jgi:hypothetical protein
LRLSNIHMLREADFDKVLFDLHASPTKIL